MYDPADEFNRYDAERDERLARMPCMECTECVWDVQYANDGTKLLHGWCTSNEWLLDDEQLRSEARDVCGLPN